AELASTKRKHTVTGPQSLLTGPNTCIQLNWMMFLRRQNRIFTFFSYKNRFLRYNKPILIYLLKQSIRQLKGQIAMEKDLINLLKSCQIFSSLHEKELKTLLKKFKKITRNKDQILFKQGDLSKELFLLVSGKVVEFMKTDEDKHFLVNEVLPGQLIGELTALSREPHSMTARAVKKSILLALSSEDFIKLCKKYNSVSLDVINSTLLKSRKIIDIMSSKGRRDKHIVILPANPWTDIRVFFENIHKHSHVHKDIVVLCDVKESKKRSLTALRKYVDKLDKENKTIVYIIQSYTSDLAKVCFELEKLDMIYVAATSTSNPKISKELRVKIDINSYKIKPKLILLHAKKKGFPQHTAKWFKLVHFDLCHHVRIHEKKDWERLLRFITGNAIGVVLGGGGLRCWAQLGAIRALNKLNIPIDAIGGSSAGAIVAGFYALNESFSDMSELRKLSDITSQTVSIKDITWPSISIFDGKNYTQQLQKIYKKMRIENLWIPCFCVTTNLATNRQIISRCGYLWKIIRSSTSVPLIFPPVIVKGKVHIDGGLLNNLPVDVMKTLLSNTGQVIAVELTHANEDPTHYDFPPILPLWSTTFARLGVMHKEYKFPPLIETFLKSLLAGASAKQEENADRADVIVSPDLSAFSLLKVSHEEEKKLIRIGYKETLKKLKKAQKSK
ncbi:MAG: patatin-like phospholipase family protein, partial [Gammaproteobacteria bacterium]